MNLEKMFEAQRELRKVGLFNYRGPDRFEKLVLALLVELGECANEHRGFKFWSMNQLPHTSAVRVPCMMDEDKEFYNPLLEEYVDGLHVVLDIGLEIGCTSFEPFKRITLNNRITDKFNAIFRMASNLEVVFLLLDHTDYHLLLTEYIELGEALGFTWEQIEQAYFEKHAINLKRQEVGY